VSEFPSTRYAGSKQKIVNWIWNIIGGLQFETCLDGFGGMASVSYKMKLNNKRVHFNDILKSCQIRGKAIIENSMIQVSEQEVNQVLKNNKTTLYPTFIADNFQGIYYTDDENKWLDMIVHNINRVEDEYKQAIFRSALYQACLIKRPFNLFHRNNLYLRLNHKESKFNNYVTWERPFEHYFRKFIKEINISIFDNGKNNKSYKKDIFSLSKKYDLVYLDPPYIGTWKEDYLTKYHFLEGLSDYDNWRANINYEVKTRKYKPIKEISDWNKTSMINSLFDTMINKFDNSIIALSYRADGYPSREKIIQIFEDNNRTVKIYEKNYQYVLSPKKTKELLFVSEQSLK
jgi:adenine-specific DNA methylase